MLTNIFTMIPLAVCFIALLIGTYTDLKTREIPDWINFSLIFLGVGINLIATLVNWNATYILNSLIGLAIGVGLGFLMFYTGQWGGGDSKMIMGLFALIGLSIFPLRFFLLEIKAFSLPFLLSFLINIVLVGAVYGIVWSTSLAIKHRKRFSKHIKEMLANKKMRLLRIILLIFAIIVMALALIFKTQLIFLIWILLLLVVLVFYLWMVVKSIEKACMIKQIPPEKLTEGDWIAEEIKIGNKVIAGPKDLSVEKRQIELLIKLKKQKKLKTVTIKEGVPFVPSFLIAFIVTYFMSLYGTNILLLFLS